MKCQICGALLPTGAMFCGECGSSSTATPFTRKRPDSRPSDTTVIAPLRPRGTVISVPWNTATPADSTPEVSVAPDRDPAGFVLQFSTGETVSVHGSGLIGRRPLPQAGETFDLLLAIADVGMSVSKTHLEFGQHDGEFWVSDRFSGNGTVLRRPDDAPVRCEPGRRYRVPRRSRVDIADQYFTVN